MCLSQVPIASHRKFSKTIPNFVLVKFQLHLIENILRQPQIMSTKFPSSCLPIPYSCQWSLNSVH